MGDNFDSCKSRQFIDFSQDEDASGDSFFDTVEEEDATITHRQLTARNVLLEKELSDPESDAAFFSPLDKSAMVNNGENYLRSKFRRSLSMNNLPMVSQIPNSNVTMDEQVLGNKKKTQKCSLPSRPHHKFSSQEHINRLSKPKHFSSQDNLHKVGSMTLAEAVNKFHLGTPKRFRSRATPPRKMSAIPFAVTKSHTPHLQTSHRARPTYALSKDQQEILEMEEAKKFKIRANPVNKRILKGPVKPHIETKPPTATEPFHLTETKKKVEVQEYKVPVFKAQPLPKSLNHPFKPQLSSQPCTKACSPQFSKRFHRQVPESKNAAEPPKNNAQSTKQPNKLTGHTLPKPFSFEKRDIELQKKKEALIQKVLEEEKKAREFHANPVPKSIIRSRNTSVEHLNDVASQGSHEELDTHCFKAKPAKVLTMKPFEPKKDMSHEVKVEPFHFSSEERLESRQQFEQMLKLKEQQQELAKKEHDELLRKIEEEEVMRLRKLTEHKAQPIKRYKEVKIQASNKVTKPISPNLRTTKRSNKENILH